jgi:hypothetical protein
VVMCGSSLSPFPFAIDDTEQLRTGQACYGEMKCWLVMQGVALQWDSGSQVTSVALGGMGAAI